MARPVVRRGALCVALALVLSGCASEHEVSETELARLMFSGDDVYQVEGEPFSGTLVVREGEKVKARLEMSDGHVDGRIESFHDNGERRIVKTVRWDEEKQRSLQDGTAEEWNAEGVRIAREEYDDNVPELKEAWCDDGKDKSREEFDDGKPRSAKAWSCDTGQLVSQFTYVDGKKQGLQETWHADGKPATRGEFREGNPVGKHEAWNEAGVLISSGEHGAGGEKTGLWTEPSGNGSRLVHYGPEGFISPAVSEAFVRAIAGNRPNAETAQFLLDEGQVKVGDALPAAYNGEPVAGQFSFPVRQWTYAVVVADPGVLPMLLAQGADINQADSEGQTRLLRCVRRFKGEGSVGYQSGCGAAELADLVAKGAKASIATREGRNPLHVLVADSKSSDWGVFGRGTSAARAARAGAVTVLAQAGADPNLADANGYTPLVLALQSRRVDLVQALLAAGAKGDGTGPGNTRAVHWVALQALDRYEIDGQFVADVIPVLAQAGADVSAPMDWDGEQVTLRDLAVRHGLVDVAKILDAHKKG